jgi:ABC-type Fe3+ transport system permease subunit
MVYIIEKRSLFWDCCKAIVKGIGFFVPAFLLSLILTIPWANRHWAGEAQASLGGIAVSFYIGVLAAIVCTIYLLFEAYSASRESRWLSEDDLKHQSSDLEDRK